MYFLIIILIIINIMQFFKNLDVESEYLGYTSSLKLQIAFLKKKNKKLNKNIKELENIIKDVEV